MAKTPSKSTPGLINAPMTDDAAEAGMRRRTRLLDDFEHLILAPSRATGTSPFPPSTPEQRAQLDQIRRDRLVADRLARLGATPKADFADADPLRIDPEALKKPDIKTLVAQALDTNIVVAVGNPVQAVTAKRGLEAAGRTVMVLNNFSAPVPEDEKRKVAQRFKDAEAGTAALIVVSEMTPTSKFILDKHPDIRDNVEKSATELDM